MIALVVLGFSLAVVSGFSPAAVSGFPGPSEVEGSRTGEQAVVSSVWDGVFTEEQARRGQDTYRQECSNCHGPALEGADMTPPLVGGAFTANWNDLTVGDLFERIRTTMPLDKPGTLTRQQNADVIAFMLSANMWPTGTTELVRDLGALKQIRIQSNKPDK